MIYLAIYCLGVAIGMLIMFQRNKSKPFKGTEYFTVERVQLMRRLYDFSFIIRREVCSDDFIKHEKKSAAWQIAEQLLMDGRFDFEELIDNPFEDRRFKLTFKFWQP